MLGRNKVEKLGLTAATPESKIRKAAGSVFATIDVNNFKYKSLSSWAYNIALGCKHGCRFCYVPSVSAIKQRPLLKQFGVNDPDADWGKYVLFRPWDEAAFLASLKRAEKKPPSKLNPDGNRAIMMCSTTDPYQTVTIPGNPAKQKILHNQCRYLVRRALELILEQSTLNVRILTRSPLAREDFDLYKKFGHRLLFGMSLPTMNDRLLKIYEPFAPGSKLRLETLQLAAKQGIPVYVAVAPTYPECDEADLRATLKAIRPLKPVTVFHEPINIRAENVERIRLHAASLKPPVNLNTEVFDNGPSWRKYAIDQLRSMQKVATELNMEGCLHLWPDKNLRSKQAFLAARRAGLKKTHPDYRETPHEKIQRRAAEEAAYKDFAHWLSHWHTRISEWPTPRSKTKKR